MTQLDTSTVEMFGIYIYIYIFFIIPHTISHNRRPKMWFEDA